MDERIPGWGLVLKVTAWARGFACSEDVKGRFERKPELDVNQIIQAVQLFQEAV